MFREKRINKILIIKGSESRNPDKDMKKILIRIWRKIYYEEK